jgi:hypothetical protein
MVAEEIQELLGFAGARSEMNVGNEQRANMPRCFGHIHDAEASICLDFHPIPT